MYVYFIYALAYSFEFIHEAKIKKKKRKIERKTSGGKRNTKV